MFGNFPRFLTGGHGLDLHVLQIQDFSTGRMTLLQIDACKKCPARWPNHNQTILSL